MASLDYCHIRTHSLQFIYPASLLKNKIKLFTDTCYTDLPSLPSNTNTPIWSMSIHC